MKNELIPYVIMIQNDLVTDTYKCKNGEQAEKKFLEICKERLSNFDTYNKDDISAILEQGYERFGKKTISIVWL